MITLASDQGTFAAKGSPRTFSSSSSAFPLQLSPSFQLPIVLPLHGSLGFALGRGPHHFIFASEKRSFAISVQR